MTSGSLVPPNGRVHLHIIENKTTNKRKYFGRDSVRDRQEPSLGQMEPSPWKNRTRPWDRPAVLCLIPQQNRYFVPFVPGTGGGHPWDDCPARAVRKMLMCFGFIGCFRPHTLKGLDSHVQGVECWIDGNQRNHTIEGNHGISVCK